MSNRAFPGLAFVSFLAFSTLGAQAQTPYSVEEVPLWQISADLASGKTSSAAVTQAYLDRIKLYDVRLHAVITVAPDALAQAAASDKRRKAGRALGPLDGVPIMLKDNIDAGGMPTTAGSYALKDNFPPKDAEVTRRLRAAGVIILGKANMSQWAGLRTTTGFNGSTTGGSNRNPYDLDKSPAGSSSGPGIVAAASLAAGAVGSDTTGSIIGPSNVNGTVGLRPTTGLIARTGIVPISSTLDSAGPMGRTVTDVAMLLNAMAGSNAADPATRDADVHKTDYVAGLKKDALKGMRIGVLRGFGGYDGTTMPILDAALAVMKSQGAQIVEIPVTLFENLGSDVQLVEAYDFKPDLEAYLKKAPPSVKTRTLADLIAFERTEPHEKLHGSDRQEQAAQLSRATDPAYAELVAFARKRAGADGYGKAMKDYNVSALVLPAGGPASVIKPDGTVPLRSLVLPKDGKFVHEKSKMPPAFSNLAAMAGYPELVVPSGFVGNMPVGMAFIGMPWSEAKLLAYGYAYEQASHARKPPTAYKQ
jgi:amidase